MPTNKKTQKPPATAQRLSSIVKSCRDIMRKDKGLNGDADRLPMLTWILFLKFMDDVEKQREAAAALSTVPYKPLIEAPYRWRDWAAAKDGITGDVLLQFINNDQMVPPWSEDGEPITGLLAYLRGLESATDAREKTVGQVFSGVINRMINGYLLRDVINKVNEIHFDNQQELHALSLLYESLLKEMRDASGDAGEFYTPRPMVKFIVEVIAPQVGETVLDPACGTGGFLIETFNYLDIKSTRDSDIAKGTIIGGEAKPLPYLLCQMNMLLHSVPEPQITYGNSLTKKLSDIGDEDRVDIIMTNPPFGGEEEAGIQNNFPKNMQTSETALLFLQLIMRKLNRRHGRGALVVPNGTLFADGVAARIKEQLLTEFNLHTIVRLGNGVFAPYTSIPTNLLFFNKTGKTEKIWYYQVPMPEGRKNYTKTKPMQFEEFADCIAWWENREENEFAWCVDVGDVLKYDEDGELLSVNLDINNPNSAEELQHRPPEELVESILKKEARIMEIMQEIRQMVSKRS